MELRRLTIAHGCRAQAHTSIPKKTTMTPNTFAKNLLSTISRSSLGASTSSKAPFNIFRCRMFGSIQRSDGEQQLKSQKENLRCSNKRYEMYSQKLGIMLVALINTVFVVVLRFCCALCMFTYDRDRLPVAVPLHTIIREKSLGNLTSLEIAIYVPRAKRHAFYANRFSSATMGKIKILFEFENNEKRTRKENIRNACEYFRSELHGSHSRHLHFYE